MHSGAKLCTLPLCQFLVAGHEKAPRAGAVTQQMAALVLAIGLRLLGELVKVLFVVGDGISNRLLACLGGLLR